MVLLTKANTIITVEGSRLQPGDVLDMLQPTCVRHQPHTAHFTISLLPLMEVWRRAVAASDCRRLRSRAENPAPSIPVVNAGESDSLVQLVVSVPQQAGRSSTVEEMAEARLTTHAGAAHLRG